MHGQDELTGSHPHCLKDSRDVYRTLPEHLGEQPVSGV